MWQFICDNWVYLLVGYAVFVTLGMLFIAGATRKPTPTLTEEQAESELLNDIQRHK